MYAKDIQPGKSDSVTPDTTVADAARLMVHRRRRALEVRNEGRLVGVLTLLDLIVRTTAEGRDPKRTRVRDLMERLSPKRSSPR
jgi:CBS domain-containing protein